MPALVQTEIRIGSDKNGNKDTKGFPISQFSMFTLSQSIFAHHTFRIICPLEAVDNVSGPVLNNSRNLIGAPITVKIKSVNAAEALQFKGVVTSIEATHSNGYTGDIIISGFSPTIVLDSGWHCKSWEQQTIEAIAEDVLMHFTKDLPSPAIKPLNTTTLLYTVQYKETAWQFLNRLSASCGEWLYYNGENLILGQPNGREVALTYRDKLSQFNLGLQVGPASFKMVAHDYINNEVYPCVPTDIASHAGLNELGKHTLEMSEKLYASRPKQWCNHFLTDKGQLEQSVLTSAAMQSSNMVQCNGTSEHPGLQVGGTVSIEGRNVHGKEESFGSYRVIAVNHSCDDQGNYSNNFVAIPASLKYPPANNYTEPYCETQSAIVTENYDSKGLGRIRVRFHWMKKDIEQSPWIRVVNLYSGGSKGMFFRPEKGEEVMVGFEGGSPLKPYIVGTVDNGANKNEFGNKDNDIKIIQTRSGNKIIMNDKEGSVHISDAIGNHIKEDGNGNINVESSETIVFTCGNSKIEMKKDGTIQINGKTITASASEKATITSGGASFVADGKKNEANMSGTKANVSGSSEAKMNAGTKATVSAGGKVDVKAGIIALN